MFSHPLSLIILLSAILLVSAALEAAVPTTATSAPIPGVRELSYTSEIDGSVQPYILCLPKGFKPDNKAKYPAVFFGVGYGGKCGPPPCQDWADQHGWVFISFDGRRRLHYNGIAERDFDQLLHRDLPRQGVPVDRDRVFFLGASQGASGAFGFGLRHPDWFCSVGGSGGFVDVDEWYPRWDGDPITVPGQPPAWPKEYNGPAWRWPAAMAYSARHHAEQAYWLSPYLHVGERDEINRAVRSAQSLGAALGSGHLARV